MYNSAYMLQNFHEPSSLTLPDKFLARSFMVEAKVEPSELLNGEFIFNSYKNFWFESWINSILSLTQFL